MNLKELIKNSICASVRYNDFGHGVRLCISDRVRNEVRIVIYRIQDIVNDRIKDIVMDSIWRHKAENVNKGSVLASLKNG